MTQPLIQSMIWIVAGGCLLFFLKRRKSKKI
jgi:hypothetical protein